MGANVYSFAFTTIWPSVMITYCVRAALINRSSVLEFEAYATENVLVEAGFAS